MPREGTFAQQALQKLICPICGGPLIGTLEEDAWGNRYCEKHAHEYPRCTCCQRLICKNLTGGGVAYSDHRLVCIFCRKTAIDSKEQAKPYIEAIAAWLYSRGFTFQHLSLRIELVFRHDLISNSEHQGSGEIQGMIYKTTFSGGGQAPNRRVEGVAILKGLSRHVMEGVAVHELGHAWLFLHGVDSLGAPVEEGFCNMLSHLYHSSFNTDEARFCIRIIEQNPDPVYGDGFRVVNAAVQKYGLSSIVDYLRRYRMLPPS
jgi:hypothetical protein